YFLFLEGNQAAVGDYSFRMVEIGSQPVLPLDTVLANVLNPGRSTVIYQLPVTAGQRLFFDGQGSNSGASWIFYNPNNQAYFGTSITSDSEVIANQSGTHV